MILIDLQLRSGHSSAKRWEITATLVLSKVARSSLQKLVLPDAKEPAMIVTGMADSMAHEALKRSYGHDMR